MWPIQQTEMQTTSWRKWQRVTVLTHGRHGDDGARRGEVCVLATVL